MASSRKVAVVVVNWNGDEDTRNCIKALTKQAHHCDIIAVDNGSSDGFVEWAKEQQKITLLENEVNLGFSGGVNTGLRHAIKQQYEYIALINNDATPRPTWLKELMSVAEENENHGIVTGKLLKTDSTIDSTGDQYTSWGLPYPRGRNEKSSKKYADTEQVFAATGGASLYRTVMLKEIGLFDEDFFAYYEDVDISFRARLAGWKVIYTPSAVAHHKLGASSGKIPGFTTYMTIKNLPWLLIKNVPRELLTTVLVRFLIAYSSIVLSSLAKGKITSVLKGTVVGLVKLPKKLGERRIIQNDKKVDYLEIMAYMTYNLPPNAHKLRKVRTILKKLRFWR